MDPDIDRQISEHVVRMHRYRSAVDGALDGGSRDREDDADASSSVFVKYNRMLHGKKTGRAHNLTIKFLKKYIHYAKHRIQPDLTDEASEHIANAYAELRNASSNGRAGGTLPITARTLETIIRLSTAHAKLKLSKKVNKADVEAALKVLNFAIYHKELTEMEEREQERSRELERKRKADHSGSGIARRGGSTTDAMEVDDPPRAAESGLDTSPERIEAFESVFGQHMRANHLDLISISEIETVVNMTAAVHYTRPEIMSLLKKLQADNRLMIVDEMVHMM